MLVWSDDHSDKISAAINNLHLDFVQTRGLILLVNDNHVNNKLKEILVYVYLGSIVSNQPKMAEDIPSVPSPFKQYS